MSTRIYVDANVYLDYFEERTNGIRPLNDFAFKIFERTLECEFEIVISDATINEIERHYKTASRANILFEELIRKGKIINANAKTEENELSKGHSDALHYMIAERTGCKFIVTRNIRHFSDFSGFVKPVLPEQI